MATDAPPASKGPVRHRTAGAGPLLREWRDRRRRSQLDLALDVGVSTRHLSFVETGRAKPSPELVLAIAQHLEVPLRERNTLLMAAGFAPRYHETPLDAPDMERMTASLQRMLDAHHPYPGVVLDRQWNVVLTNMAAAVLASGLPAELTGPPLNIFRVSLHPDGLASRTLNFDEWGSYLVTQLRRQVSLTGDGQLAALLDEVSAYPNVAELTARKGWTSWPEQSLLIPFRVDFDGVELSMFTTLTTFGTPRDITLDELAVELFFPADDATEAILRSTPTGET
jgi:transcriptional regulator with XRE-family HTH domain